MADNEKDNIDNNPAGGTPPAGGSGGGNSDFGPSFDPADDLGDDSRPAVSIAKKKNAIVFIVGFAVVMFIVYSLLGSKPKTVVTSENQDMINAKGKKSKVPSAVSFKGSNGESVANSVSASAASPGDMDNVPSMPQLERKGPQYAIQDTLPPPPPMPPLNDFVSSPYLNDVGGGVDINAGSSSGSGGGGAYGNRYTKKRSRIPETAVGEFGDQDAIAGLDPDTQKKLAEEKRRRVSASMFVGGGGGLARTTAETPDAADGAEDGFVLGESSADKTSVTVRKDLESVILQGKVMDAVLETAINTDLPGKLRAIVSRDVYSEAGKRIVIPKGSRLIGSYATDIKFGQARVYVIWSRVIRPDGVDAVLDSSDDMVAIDSLGRSGVYGELDNRFFEIFGSSILLSSLTVAFAVAADAAAGTDSGSSTTSTSTTGSTTTTTGNVVSEGVSQAVTNVGNDVNNFAKQYFKTKPRITVDQGTKIKIFVNKDIIFPPSYFSSGAPKSGTEFLN